MKKILLVGLSILLLSGCSKEKSINGTYVCDTKEMPNGDVWTEADQTFIISEGKFSVVEKLKNLNGKIDTIEESGTITETDDKKYIMSNEKGKMAREVKISKGKMLITDSMPRFYRNIECKLK